MLGEGIPAPLIEHAGARGRHAGRAAGGARRDLARRCRCTCWTRPAPTSRPKAGTLRAIGRRAAGRAHGQGARARRAAPAAAASTTTRRSGAKRLWPELKTLFEKPGAAWDIDELKDRLLYRQAIETARCLAEGVLTSVHDANIGSIFGIGFPAWTGGAMQFIASEGRDRFLARADALARAPRRALRASANARPR